MHTAQWLLDHEVAIRLGCFISIFTLMAVWEGIAPCRERRYSRLFRWANNLGLVVLNSVMLRILFPLAAVGIAHQMAQKGWGLFNLIELPYWLEVVIAVMLLDLLIYGQHVVFHHVPLLWRLHQVHHSDPDYDVTTGARFHPIEIILSMLIKMLAVILLGPAAVAVLIFEVLLNGSAMFNHSNVQLPRWLDRWIRRVFVTPDMHRVHHSQIRSETDSNYGFALSVWDRMFSTYTPEPVLGQRGVMIGLPHLDDPKEICRLDGLLILPFKQKRD